MIGPYVLARALGEGGMGVVYLATHESSGDEVALKTVKVPRAGLLQSIRREIHVLARLSHPGIVRIVDEGLHDGLPWYAMELLPGLTLRSLLWGMADKTISEPPAPSSRLWWTATVAMGREPTAVLGTQPTRAPAIDSPATDSPRLPVPEALAIARRLCDPLGYMHGEGVIHRDLKPENVLVTDGTPVIVDFGLLSRIATEGGRELLEVTGEVSGTAWYMSPEQARGDPVDARSDLYALGCVIYEMLTGRPPFTGGGLMEVLLQHVNADPEPPSRHVPGLRSGIDALVLALLAKEPADRLGHAADVANALEAVGADAPADQGPSPRPYLYRARFAGRQSELEQMRHVVSDLEQGARRLVAVEGGSGVGKTRLAQEIAAIAVRQGFVAHTVGCGTSIALPHQTATGSGPTVALNGLVLALGDTCRDLEARERDRVLGARGRILAAIEPSLAELPGVADHPPPAELPLEAGRQRLFVALTSVICDLAALKPQIVLMDDAARADELTLGWLRHVARSEVAAHARLLVVFLARSDEIGSSIDDLFALPDVTRIKLGPVPPEVVAHMVADMLALRPPPASLVRMIAEGAEGNPFFVAEYLRMALAEDLLGRDAKGRWVARASDGPGDGWSSLPLPRSVDVLVRRRLEPLSDSSRALLGVASAMGHGEDWDLLAAASPLTEGDHLEAVHDLLRRHVLEEVPGQRYAFVHGRIREAAEAAMAPEQRRLAHDAIATAMSALPPERRATRIAPLAVHWERAGELDRARPLYLAAARRAAGSYAMDEAERLYRAYLAVTPNPSSERMLARQELSSRVLHVRGRNEEALAAAQGALDDAHALGDREGEAQALVLLATGTNRLGDPARAGELASDAEALAEQLGDDKLAAAAANLMGVLNYQQGKLRESRACYERALTLLDREGERRAAIGTLINLTAVLQHQGDPDSATRASERARDLGRELGDRRGEALAIANLATLAEGHGRLDDANTLLEQALRIMREVGDRPNEGQTLANLAAIALASGKPARARALAEAALIVHHEVGNHRFEGFTLNLLGSAHYHLGSRASAREIYERAHAAQRETDHVVLDAQIIDNLVHLLVEQGELERAELLCEEGLRICRSQGDLRWLGKIHRCVATLRVRQGRLVEAHTAMAEALRAFTTVADHRTEAESRVFLASMLRDQGDLGAAARELDRAEALLSTVGSLSKIGWTVEKGHLAIARGEDGAPWLADAEGLARGLELPRESPTWEKLRELAREAARDVDGPPTA